MMFQDKMHGWWVVVVLFSVGLVAISAQTPRREKIFITAPNVFRVGVNETVTVSVFNTGDIQIPVTVYLEKRERGLAQPYSSSTVTPRKGNPATTTVRVDPQHLLATETDGQEQYVYLVARAPDLDFQEEKQILVSTKSGYLLVQTDKPIYTPNQEVKIRVVAVDQEMKPSKELMHLEIINPQGIRVEQFRETRVVNGFLDKTFRFHAEPMFGNWSVAVHHGLQFERNTTVQFEVREYVLPTFTIKVNTPDFILRDETFVDISVEAKYVYKKPVQGNFQLIMGILERDGNVVNPVVHQAPLDHGFGFYTLALPVFGQNWFENYEGRRLHITASVTEHAIGVTERLVDTSTIIVRSPYRFKPERTVRYFKPGLPYELQYELETVTGQPAQQKEVGIEAFARTSNGLVTLFNTQDSINNAQLTDVNGLVRFIFNTTRDSESINIRVFTKDNALGYNNAQYEFDANPYESPADDSYLSIQINERNLRVGDEVYANIHYTGPGPINNLNVFFVAQGKVLEARNIDRIINSPERVFFRVSADMVPSVRLVAYFITQSGQVVADSVWLHITNTCKYHVSLNIAEEPEDESNSYLPESPLTLLVDAHPTSYVGFMGVDKAVYALNNNHRLTKKKMFQMVQSYDMGCGPGGGPTSALIFKDAGMTVLTNAQLSVPAREALQCTTPRSRARNARSVTHAQIGQCLVTLQNVCTENLTSSKIEKKISRWAECEKITLKLTGYCPYASPKDMEDFKRCCSISRSRSRITTEIAGETLDAVDIRTDFRESWLFDMVHVGATGRASLDITTPGSITEWSLQAVSVTPRGGLCVADPLDVIVFKNLNLHLQLPYSVVSMEQIEIIATVYNYNSQATSVQILFDVPRGCCGESADPRTPARRDITVAGNDSRSVKFVIVPLETGQIPIVIRAYSDLGNDGIKKFLNVIPHGTTLSVDRSVLIDPSGIYRHRLPPRARAAVLDDIQSDQVLDTETRQQIDVLDLRVPADTIPGTEAAFVSLIGNLLGPIIVDPVENFGNWLQLPKGCGEQTMSIVAPSIFIIKYLQTMKLLNASVEEESRHNITRGIASALQHRREDGSFAIWGSNESYNSSTWLTAFVLKVFSHADEMTAIDRTVTCKAAEWLIRNAQNPNGSFSELYRVHHREMTGGVSGEASMTAFALISLLEGHACDSIQQDVDSAIHSAMVFLEQQVNYLTRPYAKAIVTYALALAKSDMAMMANARLKQDVRHNRDDGSRHWFPSPTDTGEDMPHWYRFRPSAIAVETTAYALLAQLELGEISYAGSIALWLSEQQNYEGGFVSTQDTVIALQALTDYAITSSSGDDIDLTCVFTSEANQTFQFQHQFLSHNALVQRHIQVPVGGRLQSVCSGKGTAKLSVKMKYNRIANEVETCPFEVDLAAREARTSANTVNTVPVTNSRSRVGIVRRSTTTTAQIARAKGDFFVNIRFCARYTQNTRTNMGIIDVGLYSGFVPVENALEDMVSSDHLHLVRRFEVSQRSVIFYLDRIPADQEICLDFNARREMIVGNIQPVAIRVYDYYSPDQSCTTYYHPLNESPLIQTLCNNDHDCVCPSGRCGRCNQREPLKTLENEMCASNEHYALKVRMISDVREGGYKIYMANVTRPLKTGVDLVPAGAIRYFYIKETCSCPRMKLRHEYTIIGSTGLQFVDENGVDSFKYLIDERSIVEWWPTNTNKRKHAEAYNKLRQLEDSPALLCTT